MQCIGKMPVHNNAYFDSKSPEFGPCGSSTAASPGFGHQGPPRAAMAEGAIRAVSIATFGQPAARQQQLSPGIRRALGSGFVKRQDGGRPSCRGFNQRLKTPTIRQRLAEGIRIVIQALD